MIRTVLIFIFGITAVSASLGHAQIQSFEFGPPLTNDLVVPNGKVIKIHSLIGTANANVVETWNSGSTINKAYNGISISLASGRTITLSPYSPVFGGAHYSLAASFVSSVNTASPNSPILIPGPITLSGTGDAALLLVYEILDNSLSLVNGQSPSQGSSVVIPTSVAGDVDVKLEQSADNVTWTECLPGTYNSSTVKRFFRLRAVEK
jgi:hypothetical protein